MFCFPRANHASPNLKKVLSWKTLQVYFISSSVETWKIFRNVLGQFIFSWADILSEENRYFGKHLFFCKTKTDYAYKLRVQDFATGKNFSFNQWFKQESFAFFSGKLFYKRNRKLFSCVCVAWYKHSRGWENSRQLRKTETKSSVCITVSNSPILWDPGAVGRAGRKDATKVFKHTFVAPFNPARLTPWVSEDGILPTPLVFISGYANTVNVFCCLNLFLKVMYGDQSWEFVSGPWDLKR